MRKSFILKAMHVIAIIAIVGYTLQNPLSAQYKSDSPYAVFGDNSKMLEPKHGYGNLYHINILSGNGEMYYADFDLRNGIVTLSSIDGKIIQQNHIGEGVKAMFTSMDPHAEKYYHLSPYSYCGGNPVNAVDPDGRDWYRNNETFYYTWYNGGGERVGFTYIGGKGSVLGEFENVINNILCGDESLGLESLYSDGFTFDIAPNDKGGLIGSKERGWDFFDEFVYGLGPEFSVILSDHPYTQAVMNDEFVRIYQDELRSRGNNGKYTNVGRPEFFPWQASPNSPMQFIGTYRYDGYSSNDGHYINNVVTDSKSVTSLGYHIKFLNNHRRSQMKEFGNTYQFYIWKSLR